MFCAPITFLQNFKDIKPGVVLAPNSVTGGGANNPSAYPTMFIYFRLHCLLYIFNRAVDASQANLLKKALTGRTIVQREPLMIS